MDKYKEYIALAKSDIKVAKMVLDSATDELVQNITELSKDLDELSVKYPDWIHERDDMITSWATTIRYNANFKADHDEIAQTVEDTLEWIEAL